MKKEDAIKDLLCVKNIFDNLKVPFFLDQGTCLGAYRDKGFIDGDEDIDIGVFGARRRDDIRYELRKQGFSINPEATKTITADRNTHIDIHFFIRDGNEFVCYARDGCLAPLLCFPSRFNKLEKIKFYENDFLVLSPIEDYLQYIYGKNWRRKIKGKIAKDYWGAHPKRVAKLLIEKHLENRIDASIYPKVKNAIKCLMKIK